MSQIKAYRGRFAPSPTGPLHAGSLVAALASWLDARAHGGSWLVRIEDVDTPRCVPGADRLILQQLADCGLHPDEPPAWQSQRSALYQQALERLVHSGRAYPCACSRKDIEEALRAQGHVRDRHTELVYPGTCRHGLQGREARAWRLNTERIQPSEPIVRWTDRRLGPQSQNVAAEVGDFVLRRADGLYAYQLAVVVDDADQHISHIVRGEDLTDNTARQILLQQALGLATPAYLHTPLVCGANGEKLSKQNGATALDTSEPMQALNAAAAVLGLPEALHHSVAEALASWVAAWRDLYNPASMPEQTEPTSPTAHQAPSDVAHPRAIRSFVRRAGRTTTGQAKAYAEFGPEFLLPYRAAPLELAAAFGREAPTILEIGFGMGEATAHIAALMPEKNFLCCEVHEPGVGALLKRIGEKSLSNIRIVAHDAVEVLDQMLLRADDNGEPSLQVLDGIHIFFPDPWHKKRHHKRRLIQPPMVAKLAAHLKAGGYLHCATDWQPYAEQMLDVLQAEHSLRNSADGFAPRPDYRPLTKFENRGLRLGHGVWDLVFVRRRLERTGAGRRVD